MTYGDEPTVVARNEWDAVVVAFRHFFEPLGTVTITATEVEFEVEETGLSLGSDGSSRSFMPLHALGMRWETVEFDDNSMEVRLAGDAGTYTYRVPPRLLGRGHGSG